MRNTAIILVGVFIAVLILEITCRFLPIVSVSHDFATYRNLAYPRHTPQLPALWSTGPLLHSPITSKVNNEGFVSSLDYSKGDMPTLTLIGDSYIEALMVPEESRVHSHLNRYLKGQRQIQALGFSGGALSLYLTYALMARAKFSPCAIIFNIVSNDFDQSMPSARRHEVFPYFSFEEGQAHLVSGSRPSPSFLKRILHRSHFARYLRYNVKPQTLWNSSTQKVNKKDSKLALRAFFTLIERELPDIHIFFILDADRQQIYGQTSDTHFSELRLDFLTAALNAGHKTLDLQPVFEELYNSNHRRFEFKDDYHWNSYAHEQVAHALTESTSFNQILNSIECNPERFTESPLSTAQNY